MSPERKDEFREEDMYKPLHDYLASNGYTVKSEVGHCDIMAAKDGDILIVEMKKSLNLDVIVQAALRQRITHNVYVAVPKPGKGLFAKRWKNICYLLRRLELGLMLVSLKKGLVDVVFVPEPFDREKSVRLGGRKRRAAVKEFQGRHWDFNTGGSTGKKLVTAYKEMAIHIACCLEKHGPLKTSELRKLGTDSDKTTRILGDNHYGWFEKISRGVYGLTDEGRQDINRYTKLVEYYRGIIKDKDG